MPSSKEDQLESKSNDGKESPAAGNKNSSTTNLGKVFESQSSAASFLRKLVSRGSELSKRSPSDSIGSQTNAVASVSREESKREEVAEIANFMKGCETAAPKSEERQFTTMLDTMKSIGSIASIGSIESIGNLKDDMDTVALAAYRKGIGNPKDDTKEPPSGEEKGADSSAESASDGDKMIDEAALRIVQYMKSSEEDRKKMDEAAMASHLLRSSESTKRAFAEAALAERSGDHRSMLAHFVKSAGSEPRGPDKTPRDEMMAHFTKTVQLPHPAVPPAVAAPSEGKSSPTGVSQKSMDEAALIAHIMTSAGNSEPEEPKKNDTKGAAVTQKIAPMPQKPTMPPVLAAPHKPASEARNPEPPSTHGFRTTPQSAAKPNVDKAALNAHFMKSADSTKNGLRGDGPPLTTLPKSTSELTKKDLEEAALIAHFMKSAESTMKSTKENESKDGDSTGNKSMTFDEFIECLRKRKKDLEDAAALASYMKRAVSSIKPANVTEGPATKSTDSSKEKEKADLIAHSMKSSERVKNGKADSGKTFAKSAESTGNESTFFSDFMKSCESESDRAAFLSMLQNTDNGEDDISEAFAYFMKSSDFSSKKPGGAAGTSEDNFIANSMQGFGKSDGEKDAGKKTGRTGSASVANFMKSFDFPGSGEHIESSEFLKSAGGSMFLTSQLSNIFNSSDWLPEGAEKEIDNDLVSRFLHSQTSEEVWSFLSRGGSAGAPAAPPRQAPEWSRYGSKQPPPPPPTRPSGTDWSQYYQRLPPAYHPHPPPLPMTHPPHHAMYYPRSQPTLAEEAAVALASITPRHAKENQNKGSKKSPKRKRPRRNYEPENKVFVEVMDEDVLFGRGGRTNHHPGNKKYLAAKDAIQARYMAADKNEKTAISQELVDQVKAWGGRFLRLERGTEDKWYEVVNIVARKKASQSLREINTAEERAAKRARYSKKEDE